MAIVVKGDALDEASVKAAFDQIEEVDAVISTVGGTPADPRADSEVLAAAGRARSVARRLWHTPEISLTSIFASQSAVPWLGNAMCTVKLLCLCRRRTNNNQVLCYCVR